MPKLSQISGKEIDPDLFDVLVQSLSLLSSIATLAATWKMLTPAAGRGPTTESLDTHIRQHLRNLKRSIEDVFDNTDQLLALIRKSGTAQDDPFQARPRFGASVFLDRSDLPAINSYLLNITQSCLQARTAVINIENIISSFAPRREGELKFDYVETLNDDLNSILFESPTIDDAFAKLQQARQMAEQFVSTLEAIFRSN